MSVCFLTSALLSGLGLLVYALAAMLGRALRFAVWRALGMHRGEVIAVVSLEYVITLAYGISAGAAVGVVASRLYVPFLAITGTPERLVPPFVPLIDWRWTSVLGATMGVVLLLMEGLVLWRATRVRVFEMLRMGIHP